MKTSKFQTLMLGALLVAGACFTPALRAEGDAGKPAKEERKGGPRGDRMLQMMRERLNLTDEQVEKLKVIFKAQAEEVQALREANKGGDRAAMREKMDAIREKYKAQIEAVLTAEQKAAWEAMKEQRRGGGEGEGAGAPPPPPPAAE